MFSKKAKQAQNDTVDLDPISEEDVDGSHRGSQNGGGSGSGGDGPDNSNSTSDVACEIRKLAGKDNRNVRIWKFMVVVIIAIAGALVSTGIYFYLKFQEDEEVKDSFGLFANTIEDVSRIQYKALVDSTAGLSNMITAEANAFNMTFPFVTLDNFEVFARDARLSSKAELMSYSPRVPAKDIAAFNQYAAEGHAQRWIAASQRITNQMDDTPDKEYDPIQTLSFIYDTEVDITTGEQSISPTTTDAEVLWQTSPVIQNGFLLMSNLMSITTGTVQISPYEVVRITQEPTFGSPALENALWVDATVGAAQHQYLHESMHAEAFDEELHKLGVEHEKGEEEDLMDDAPLGRHKDHEAHARVVNRFQPHGMVLTPVFDSLDQENRNDVGTIIALFSLDVFLLNLLPNGVNGFYIVVQSSCGEEFTYRIDGNHATYLGEGDLSEPVEDALERHVDFKQFYENPELQEATEGACLYSYKVSSSAVFEDSIRSEVPVVFACVVAAIFFIMAVTFFVYDSMVSRRNAKVWGAAVRSTAIVSSLFPSQVRDQIYANPSADKGSSSAKLRRFMDNTGTTEKSDAADSDDVVLDSKPIAELYPNTTVMFCDIAGFTAWSSVREPSQVFTLLETVYRAFDRMARARHVFKVETVGDCYVAVAGCPDPMKNHAVVISRFALECMTTMDNLTKRLEVTLGPDTGDLAVRIGLHSGPVTAGVLRGERARFQLFGDTMNTAARMESTGERGRIQVSEETADLLVQAGKKHWLLQRADIVYAKGKGALKTFWLVDEKSSSDARSSNGVADTSESSENPNTIKMESKVDRTEVADPQAIDAKTERLINWNVDVMWRLLKKVVARRISHDQANQRVSPSAEEALESNNGGSVLSEVREIISLPKFDPIAHKKEPDSEDVELGEDVKDELQNFVASIASMYRFNPFHSFEHASHVTMSVVKLLSRIVAPIDEVEGENAASSMHDHTYGITSDPLTQFACVLSALIHDADHPGVPNTQLVKEENHLAKFYNNQSVAEQNSVDLAWNLLMDESFKNLRAAIYGTEEEMRRFRQLVVNSVMATDIVDKELKSLRNARWEKAFSETATKDENERDTINRKATIVIEHLIQASDVAHTMQHWHIYRKWNERFFMECYAAYKAGRAASNPADGWYKGELGFFDFYIIPLAKKLKECGVFGVASEEYLNYAQKNRQEWEIRGAEIVASMVEKVGANDENNE